MPFQEEQLNLIRWIQETLRSPGMDFHFRIWNFVDSIDFMFLLLPFVWIGYSRRFGLQLLYASLLSGLSNSLLKNFFQVLRPLAVDPSVGAIHTKSFSFPSGAAQSAAWLAVLFILHFRTRAVIWLAVGFALMLSFSRIYLGAHYPTDLVAGWSVGLFTAWVVSRKGTFDRLLLWWEKATRGGQLLWAAATSAAIMVWPTRSALAISMLLLGVHLALMIHPISVSNASQKRSYWVIVCRGVIGMGGFFILNHLVEPTSPLKPFTALLAGVWMGYGGEWIMSSRSKGLMKRCS